MTAMGVAEFRWSTAPLRDISYPLWTGGIYLLICLLHRLFYGSTPQEITPLWSIAKYLVPYHNLFLALISFIMFLGCSIAVVQQSWQSGSYEWLICDNSDAHSDGALGFWAYIYYLSKYYELIDTFLQLIRGKYPPHYLLHAYHHGLVILMSWMWLEYAPSLRFAGLLFNTLVHVVMYYYFYLKSLNIEPWWKNYVTTFQIIQFVSSLILFAMTLYFHNYIRPCNGMNYLYYNGIFNVSLLFGFVNVLGKGKRRKKE